MLALALGRITGLRLIGELADGREGLEFCLREKPDLLVVDLFLPGMHGLEIVKIVREKLPATRILVLTSHPDGELPSQLIRQGVHGFVDKTAPLNYVLQAVESVMKGGIFLPQMCPRAPMPLPAIQSRCVQHHRNNRLNPRRHWRQPRR